MIAAGSERSRTMLTGLVTLVLVAGLMTVGVKYAFGEFVAGYELTGTFANAGQGLPLGSDVSMRGVDIGRVEDIKLTGHEAQITLFIFSGHDVPTTTQAVIRPKTLFGPKFVDLVPGEGEGEGPYYSDGDRIRRTLAGFELEEVLVDLYPVLQAVEPVELATVLTEFANAADGVGPAINRSIVNFERLTDLQVRHDADVRQFLTDFALIAEELAVRAPDAVELARNLNAVLPTINSRSDDLAALLGQTARLSADLADVFEANREFFRTAIVEGGRGLQVLFDHRDRIGPLVTSLRSYLSTLAQAPHIPLGDGTFLYAVKTFFDHDPCLLFIPSEARPCPGNPEPPVGGAGAQSAQESPPPPPLDPGALTAALDPIYGLPIDEATGLLIDTATGLLFDPVTNQLIDPVTLLPIDPAATGGVAPPVPAPVPAPSQGSAAVTDLFNGVLGR